jgi:hypothetical protein
VIAGRCLKVTGRLQRDGDVVHVVAGRIDDISLLLDEIVGIASPANTETATKISPPA